VTKPFAGRPWYVYQVQLGADIDTHLQEALSAFPHGGTIHDPEAQNLDALREKLKEAAHAPAAIRIELPDRVEVMLREAGVTISETVPLSVEGEISHAALTASIEDRSRIPSPIDLGVEMVSIANKGPHLRVSATARETLANGTHEGRLRVETIPGFAGGASLAAETGLVVHLAMKPPLWPKVLAAVLASLLLLICIAAFHKRRRASRLSGELEYWPEGKPGERRRVSDLTALGRKAVIGSESIPLPAGSGQLGTLGTRKIAGQYHVVVNPEPSKKLTVNKKAMTELVLYDRDVFVLENWEFNYKGDVGMRPR
jgi:hypothetical protein